MHFRLFLLLSALACACTSNNQRTIAHNTSPDNTSQGTESNVNVPPENSNSPHYTSLTFNKGETYLGEENKASLRELVKEVKASGKTLDDIKILTWADKEYRLSQGATEAPNSDIILARQRAESIKKFLEQDLDVPDVDFYNMAQRPGPLGRYFKTDETKVKEAFQANHDEKMLKNDHASMGLVIVEYEGNKF